jgi:hypothetical protein
MEFISEININESKRNSSSMLHQSENAGAAEGRRSVVGRT